MNARMVQMLGLLWMKLVVPSEIEHSSSVVILRGVIKKQREKNLDERKTYRVDHPGWLLRQLALDSPSCTFLADEPSRKNRIEIWIAICLSIRFDHQSLPHFLGLSLILKPTQCFETTLDFIYDYMILDMRPPCVWKLFPQPPYQGLLNLLVRNWLIPNIQNGQNFQYGQNVQKVQTSWSVSVTKSLAALFSVTYDWMWRMNNSTRESNKQNFIYFTLFSEWKAALIVSPHFLTNSRAKSNSSC